MAATIFQGTTAVNTRNPEMKSIIYSLNTFPHATKSITLTPRETSELVTTPLFTVRSQGRKTVYKYQYKITTKLLDTRLSTLRQLYYHMQQPVQAQYATADGEFYTWIPNAITAAAQVAGGATGTGIGTLSWKFTCNEKERFVEVTYSGEMSPAEATFFDTNIPAAVVGTAIGATGIHTKGTFANLAANAETAAYQNPGFISAQVTNTGGTALIGILESSSLDIETIGSLSNPYAQTYGQKTKHTLKFSGLGVASNDMLAAHSSALENTTITLIDRMGIIWTYTNALSIVSSTTIGDSWANGAPKMKIDFECDGMIVANPDDSAVVPMPNQDWGQNVATTAAFNLVNN